MRVERVLAPNPSLFTGPGTNTYVISSAGDAIVLDPGPVIDRHLASIETALAALIPMAVIVTHTHPDHAPAANVLGARLGIPVLGYRPGPEFEPSATLEDGDVVTVGEIELHAIHTPGHTDDHLCYRIADAIFTGDHIMGGSTVIVEDAIAYMASLRRLEGLKPMHLYPGHGPELPDAGAVITEYIEHRLERERQILSAIAAGATTVDDIVRVVYTDVDESLHFAAAFQVRTQLAKLQSESRVSLHPGKADDMATVRLVEEPTE
jgi:glyoxylase-like metal-dependent hydrolase (beta-lactamase superfamily II)